MSRALRSVPPPPPSAAVAELRRLFSVHIGQTIDVDLLCAPRHGHVTTIEQRTATLRVLGLSPDGEAVDLQCVDTGIIVRVQGRDLASDRGWTWIELRPANDGGSAS